MKINRKLLKAIEVANDALVTLKLSRAEELDLLVRLLAVRISALDERDKRGLRSAVIETLDEYLATLARESRQ